MSALEELEQELTEWITAELDFFGAYSNPKFNKNNVDISNLEFYIKHDYEIIKEHAEKYFQLSGKQHKLFGLYKEKAEEIIENAEITNNFARLNLNNGE